MVTITPPTADIRQTLAERGSRYGRYDEQGYIEQGIKRVMADSPNWPHLRADAKSALEMIAVKISRILKGDPDHSDSWHDIAGYATLIEDRINGTGAYTPSGTVDVNEVLGRRDSQEPWRCSDCYAELGHAHAPDCPRLQR